jgi:hypothetical protein
MSNLFENAFKRVLVEADDMGPELSDADAMATTLDKGTTPSDYDIEAGTQQASIAAAKANVAMVEKLHSWIERIAEFTDFFMRRVCLVQSRQQKPKRLL